MVQEYLVWDKTATIEFVKASKKKVRSIIKISDNDLDEIRRNTENGDKYFSRFFIEIRDTDDELVARCEKVIYVRRKAKQAKT